MNDALKQRLVGAAVLLILAGLLWPILFNFDENMRGETMELTIPEVPAARKKVVSTQRASQSNDTRANTKEKPVSKRPIATQATATKSIATKDLKVSQSSVKAKVVDSVVIPDKPATAQLDARGVPVSYIVQIGTFTRWENADKLRNALIDGDLKAYVKPETSVQAGPYQVAVGPLLTYADAEAVNGEVRKNHAIKDAIIRRFKVGR